MISTTKIRRVIAATALALVFVAAGWLTASSALGNIAFKIAHVV